MKKDYLPIAVALIARLHDRPVEVLTRREVTDIARSATGDPKLRLGRRDVEELDAMAADFGVWILPPLADSQPSDLVALTMKTKWAQRVHEWTAELA